MEKAAHAPNFAPSDKIYLFVEQLLEQFRGVLRAISLVVNNI